LVRAWADESGACAQIHSNCTVTINTTARLHTIFPIARNTEYGTLSGSFTRLIQQPMR